MKIDYLFLKQLCNLMIEHESYTISTLELLDELKDLQKSIADIDDKYYRHLLLLKDCHVIEEVTGRNLGCSYLTNESMLRADCLIRLTLSGYDFSEMLNKRGFIEKVKKMSISSALFIGKQMAEQWN